MRAEGAQGARTRTVGKLEDAAAGSNDWFTRRTYRTTALDLFDVVAAKQSIDMAVSVVIPASNEAGTVAGVVRAARTLVGRLVDQVVVIDDRSTDTTAEKAADAGAEVYASVDLLPQYGPTQGKGDVLWRSLTVARGDVVVFVDADLADPDPRLI